MARISLECGDVELILVTNPSSGTLDDADLLLLRQVLTHIAPVVDSVVVDMGSSEDSWKRAARLRSEDLIKDLDEFFATRVGDVDLNVDNNAKAFFATLMVEDL